MSDIITTPRGARVIILRRPNKSHIAVRDDGYPIYGAASRWDVADYLRRYADVIQPAPEDKRRYF